MDTILWVLHGNEYIKAAGQDSIHTRIFVEENSLIKLKLMSGFQS